MNSYTNVFGGDNINPSSLSWKGYAIAADLRLVWPFEALDGANVAAAKMDISASLSGLSVFLPDARSVSVGQDLLFNNTGATDFTVRDFDGNTLINISPGIQWYLYLINNSTEAGAWRIVQFAAGTSSANAASLAGAGLRANVSLLDQNLRTTVFNTSHNFVQNDRATVARNNTGAVTYTFDPAASLANGWFSYIINGGTGVITLDPNGAETIDGQPTKLVNPGESLIVFSDGINLWTLGYGRVISSTVTGASIIIAGAGDYSLSSAESLAQVQDFSGALTGARTVLYGTGVGYWFIRNLTTGAFATTFKTNLADAGVVVPQGTFSILRSNGTNMAVAFTATSGTVTQINTAAGELTGGPISSTGTIGLANSPVVAGIYGGTGLLVAIQIDIKGRIIAATQAQLSIADSAVVTSAQLAAVISNETGTGLLVFNDGATLNDVVLTGNPTAPTPAPGDNDSTVPTTAFVQAAIAAAIALIPGTAGFKTGDVKYTLNDIEEAGYVWLNGRTLGATGSAAVLAGVVYQPLYEFVGNKYSDALWPVSGGRGATATADFIANKTLTMLDSRGTVLAAAENMGGTNRGNLGNNPSVGGFPATASLGLQSGQKSHVQTVAEMSFHNHLAFFFNGGSGVSGGGNAAQAGGSGDATSSSGGNVAANVTQPTLICNVLVKL